MVYPIGWGGYRAGLSILPVSRHHNGPDAPLAGKDAAPHLAEERELTTNLTKGHPDV